MTDVETLAERLHTVERAVTDGTAEFPEVTELATVKRRLETVEKRVDELDDRTAELEAATQAVRGYVGNIRSVNEDVEQRADAALAATDRLEVRLEAALADESDTGGDSQSRESTTGTPSEPGRQRTEHPRNDAVAGDEHRPDFSAITDPARPEESEPEVTDTTDPGLLERIRALL